MTQSWRQPSFSPENASGSDGGEPANIFDVLETQTDGTLIKIDDPKLIFSHVAGITRARANAAVRKLKQEQCAAADENQETIGALVDLLAELDYPGAKIVHAIIDEPRYEGIYQRKEFSSEQILEVPLWPIGTSFDEKDRQSVWCFGPDKRLYTYRTTRIRYGSGKESYDYSVYVPVNKEDAEYLKRVFEVKDALNVKALELPAEDDLLQ